MSFRQSVGWVLTAVAVGSTAYADKDVGRSEGIGEPVVVLPDSPTAVEKSAAAELAGELGKCIGKAPDVGARRRETFRRRDESLPGGT